MQGKMYRFSNISLFFLTFLTLVSLHAASAASSEKRLALVIGNAAYKAKALATPVNDAALVAQTLQAAGFDVVGARDLDGDLLRQTFRDFVDRVTKAGPEAVAVVYFAGYGLQLEGENYLVPIDADITDASDVPVRALRLSEQTRALTALQLKAALVIMDMARASPFVLSGQPPASGLAWVEPEANMLIAFNAAPGTASPDDRYGYGPYAMALAEMIREGGLTPANIFARVRLRVNESTKGAQVPWDTSKTEMQFMFLERGPGAPSRADSPANIARMRFQPMRSIGVNDAYVVALMRDTFDAYADFLAEYWHDPMTTRVRALLAARREAITWRRTYQANVPNAYWSYLERYPRGLHVADARRLLARSGAPIAPPFKFKIMEYDVPPPLPDELEYIERAVLTFNDPAFAFEPPQPSPVYFLEPPTPELLALAPPDASAGAHALPEPMFLPLPAHVSVPPRVVAPPLPEQAAGKNLVDSTRLPSPVTPSAPLIDSQTPPPPVVKPVASEEIKAPSGPPLASVTSLGPTENETSTTPGIEQPELTANIEPPISDPTTPPPTDIPLEIGRATMLSPPPGVVPMPRPRPVLRALSLERAPPKPVANAASASSPTEVSQPPPPLLSRLGSLFSSAPKEAPAISPPKPQKKLCPVVNGIRNCG
jgi:uncharacterized caspase-like protein